MNLITRIYNRLFNILRIFHKKNSLGNRLVLGGNMQWKNTSRINIWDLDGKIIIGDSFSMGYNSELYSWNKTLKIGNNTTINDNCKIYGNVNIGSNCLLASNIFISSGLHNFRSQPSLPIKTQDKLDALDKRVIIEDDCWIGWGAVIMPGVYIGKGAIIGSNAVVTKNVLPYTINGGVPSKQIGKRLDFTQSFTAINSKESKYFPFFYRGINYKQFDLDTSYPEGISIIDDIAVFLFSKSKNYKLKIAGQSKLDIDLEIYFNNDRSARSNVMSGMFSVDIDLTIEKFDQLEDYNTISDELKTCFDIVIIKISSTTKELKPQENDLKLISIGLYED